MNKPLKTLGLLIVLLAVVGGMRLWMRPQETWDMPQVVKVQTDTGGPVLMPLFNFRDWVIGPAGEGQPAALLLRDGDCFMDLESEHFLRYKLGDGHLLKVAFTNWCAKIGDAIVTLSIGSAEGQSWLGAATDREIAKLRTLAITNAIDPSVLGILKRAAAVNPRVDLVFTSSEVLSDDVLALFQPEMIFIDGTLTNGAWHALANQSGLETLLINATEAGSLNVLTNLPKLRRLVLNDWDVAKAGPLPTGLDTLKSLQVLDFSGTSNLAALSNAPPGLEELLLPGTADAAILSGISHLTNLQSLYLKSLEELPVLSALPRLRNFVLPANATQDQFAEFVVAHADLQILDLRGAESVTNLAPLATLGKLQAVMLGQVYANMEVLQKLGSLRYVGLPMENPGDLPEQVAALRQALPEVVIVGTQPLCLGSGWILLLVPCVALSWKARRGPRRNNPAA